MRGTAPGMTIEENLALAAGKGGWLSHTTRQEKERFREELKKLDIGLEERMSHPVGLLSGGQRQALTLLMATMNPRNFFFWMNIQQHLILAQQKKF
mgnify:CR=1 FL=1